MKKLLNLNLLLDLTNDLSSTSFYKFFVHLLFYEFIERKFENKKDAENYVEDLVSIFYAKQLQILFSIENRYKNDSWFRYLLWLLYYKKHLNKKNSEILQNAKDFLRMFKEIIVSLDFTPQAK